MRVLVVVIFIFLTNASAFAEQCISLNRTQAIKAQVAIENVSLKVKDFLVIDHYCEHCFDPYPKPIVVDSVHVDHDKNGYYIKINDEKIDIAYIYVDNKNLASLAGCKAIAVSNEIGL